MRGSTVLARSLVPKVRIGAYKGGFFAKASKGVSPWTARMHVPDGAAHSCTGMESCQRIFPLELLGLQEQCVMRDLSSGKLACLEKDVPNFHIACARMMQPS